MVEAMQLVHDGLESKLLGVLADLLSSANCEKFVCSIKKTLDIQVEQNYASRFSCS